MKWAFVLLLFTLCLSVLLVWRCRTIAVDRLRLLESSLSVWYKPVSVSDIQIYGESLVQDGNFERTDVSPWFSIPSSESVNWKIKDGIGQEGSHALCLRSPDKNPVSVCQRICFRVPPSVIYASCWIRSEKKDSRLSCLMVEVEQFFNLYGEDQEPGYGMPLFGTPSISCDPSWKKIEVVAPLHPDTKSIVIRCLTDCSENSVYIDNIEVFAAYQIPLLEIGDNHINLYQQ